ncbi:MAG TPA: pitrilysin family protein [Candidatus Elarobacter sp.]|nr:pitrilysin family protein [Candidatus Elarobacter sp.]
MSRSRLVRTTIVATLLASPALLPAQVDRSKPPTLGAPPALRLPPVSVRQLPNGLRLMVVERHGLPLANFVLVVPTGAAANPADRAGVADLASQMLTEGTATRTSLQIADQIAYLGIGLGAASGWDATTVSLTTPTAQLDSALALFADVALHPSFPEAEWARIKQERLTSLLQLKDRGPAIANRVYQTILYGSDSPYGRPAAGTTESVTAMTAGDANAFYRAHFLPNNATLIAVGDVTPAQLEQKIGALFGGWAKGTEGGATVGAPPAPAATTIYLVDKPGAAQSSFRIGSVGVPRSTPDYYPIRVMNTALGGSFTSRLNQDLREVKGYTYGAGSNFDMRKSAGPFTASAEIVSAKTDSALIDFMQQLRAIRDTMPTPELTKTKRYMELELPSTFETNGAVASRLADVALYGLPLDYYNHSVASIDAVTQGDVQRVARQYVDPAHLAIVIVGDRKSIEGPLKALNIAPLAIRDMNGNPAQ